MQSAFAGGRRYLGTGHAFQALRSAYAFLTGRAHTAALDRTETRLTTRLALAYEGELKTGLRVLIVGVGIIGGWATLMPLSGAVIVPGTLVVESDVKKIQHPTGGVVANIPIRDGVHVEKSAHGVPEQMAIDCYRN